MQLIYLHIFRTVRQRTSLAFRSSYFPVSWNISEVARLFSTKSDDGGDSKTKESKTKKNEGATENSQPSDDSSTLKLAKPGGMGKAGVRRQMQQETGQISAKKPSGLKDGAVSKDDTSSDSDDELISSSSTSSSSDEERDGDKKLRKDKPSEVLTPEMRRAVKDVSKSLGGDENRTRSDLLKKLMDHERESYKASKIEERGGQEEEETADEVDKTEAPSSDDLRSLLGGMKVDKTIPMSKTQPVPRVRAAMARASDQLLSRYKKIAGGEDADAGTQRELMRRAQLKQQQYERTDFFDPGAGLGIFQPVQDKLKPSPPLLPVWENLELRRLKMLTAREPRNGFEELIRWTEEGKLHQYPIDNDYGHYEVNVPFHEHVFLEQLLEDGFPTAGPIRHFMDIVVHGLSSNPYMTVEKKHEHIDWFRDYFKQRGAEITKLHELDVKHQQAIEALEAGGGEGPQETASPTMTN